jgi:tRNA nucleotidyltransferase (CCA-adding enzyme)
MKIAAPRAYIVGGYVRDRLLGLEPKDRDWVVVGSTPQEMLDLGFQQVGADFPVFLHPETSEHYALARRERKVRAGHRGFEVDFGPEVTLVEDLRRRDLTINAIAMDGDAFIDPHCGRADLGARVLRAVSASSFADDPLRVVRLARFAARLPRFEICPATVELARAAAVELPTLTPERLFAETCGALLTLAPSLFFETLRKVGALEATFPEIARLIGARQHPDYHPEGDAYQHTLMVLGEAAYGRATAPDEDAHLSAMFAALYHDVGKGETPAADLPHHYGHEKTGAKIAERALGRLRAPVSLTRFVIAAVRNHMRAHRWRELRAGTVLEVLDEIGALREPARLSPFLWLAYADSVGRASQVDPAQLRERDGFFMSALAAARSVRGADLVAVGVKPGPNPGQIGPRLREARIKAIKARTGANRESESYWDEPLDGSDLMAIREQGAQAARRCRSLESNPWRTGTAQAAAWEDGWSAETKRKLEAMLPRQRGGAR